MSQSCFRMKHWNTHAHTHRPGAQLSTKAPRALPFLQSSLKLLMGSSGTLFWTQVRSRCLGVAFFASSSSSSSHTGMEMEQCRMSVHTIPRISFRFPSTIALLSVYTHTHTKVNYGKKGPTTGTVCFTPLQASCTLRKQNGLTSHQGNQQ